MFEYKRSIAAALRAQAVSVLNTPDVDVRELIVGGSAVTTAQTQLPPSDSGSAVDLVLNGVGSTSVGWSQPSSIITANTFVELLDQTKQTTTPRGKILAFYGLIDYTPAGADLEALRFRSGNNVKAFIPTREIYESFTGQFIGGHFADEKNGLITAVLYGLTPQEPISIQGLWQTSADKIVALRALIAEKAGSTVTTPGVVR
jgi:hypothetical protein